MYVLGQLGPVPSLALSPDPNPIESKRGPTLTDYVPSNPPFHSGLAARVALDKFGQEGSHGRHFTYSTRRVPFERSRLKDAAGTLLYNFSNTSHRSTGHGIDTLNLTSLGESTDQWYLEILLRPSWLTISARFTCDGGHFSRRYPKNTARVELIGFYGGFTDGTYAYYSPRSNTYVEFTVELPSRHG